MVQGRFILTLPSDVLTLYACKWELKPIVKSLSITNTHLSFSQTITSELIFENFFGYNDNVPELILLTETQFPANSFYLILRIKKKHPKKSILIMHFQLIRIDRILPMRWLNCCCQFLENGARLIWPSLYIQILTDNKSWK